MAAGGLARRKAGVSASQSKENRMTKTPTKHDGPHHVDVHVGRRVYEDVRSWASRRVIWPVRSASPSSSSRSMRRGQTEYQRRGYGVQRQHWRLI